ncbi:hypothetical protein AJ79_05419 [Helicocarpus griseus UAMH5409]|uniref:Uncharacterized protein n=1 Tax=Helicocarpus griseus UAMH5409 TaxID=1447875 RepID=A0A2B7XN63_9EURO|nr:hypothetical protein AJ79_05419 [Helicocarpus griseus UAMH5409]
MLYSPLFLFAVLLIPAWGAADGGSSSHHKPRPSNDPPLPPSQDCWYEQPADIDEYKPGELIRSRQIENELKPFIELGGDVSVHSVYQYLFRTTDSLGNAVAAVTTLIIPYNSDPSKLLVYLVPYDSANPDCSPSYALRSEAETGSIPGNGIPQVSVELPFIAAALNQGMWVTVPDYEGLEAQFTAGLQAGYATLDSVRVVLKEGRKIGLTKHVRYAMWGYSGGALAGGWAAELQQSYAPELRFAGAALGGNIVNTTSVIETLNGGPSAYLGFRGLYGLAKAYPNLTDWLNENLLPDKQEEFFRIATSCQFDGQGGEYQDLFSYSATAERSLYEPVPSSVLRWSGWLGFRGTPKMPLYVYKAVADEIAPVENTDELVQKYCSNGATVEYYRNLVGTHFTEVITGSVNALGWISDRLAGVTVSNKGSCNTEDVAISEINPSIVPRIGVALYFILGSTLGDELGPP